jgi:hypothetical protein
MRRICLMLVSMIFLLTACGTGVSPMASAAQKDVQARSKTAGLVMSQALRPSPALEHAARVRGDIGVARIEIMEADGDGLNGHVLLRISAKVPEQGFTSGSTATACYRYDMNDNSDGSTPHEVTCPHNAPIVGDPNYVAPALPKDAEQRLRSALAAKDPQAAARAAFAGTPGVLSTATVNGALGVSVRLGDSTSVEECVFGQLKNGQIEVWVANTAIAQPNEMNCGASFAAQGLGRLGPVKGH